MTKPTPEQIDALLHGSPMPRRQIETMGRAYKRLDGFFYGNWTASKPGLTERQLYMLWRVGVWSWGGEAKLPDEAKGLGWDGPPVDPNEVKRQHTQGVVPCVECGKLPVQVGGEGIYPHRSDLAAKRYWQCACGAYCGSHAETGMPLGSPAGPETRRARSDAHAAFDPIWKQRRMSRQAAYDWLATQMDMTEDECHIGLMTADEARQAAEFCRAFRQ